MTSAGIEKCLRKALFKFYESEEGYITMTQTRTAKGEQTEVQKQTLLGLQNLF